MTAPQEVPDANKQLRMAVVALRNRLGMTQTEFGNRLGKGLATIQRYEGLVPPKGSVLAHLMTIALEANETATAEVFRQALSEELGHDVPLPRPTMDESFPAAPGEDAELEICKDILRDPGLAKANKILLRATALVKRDKAQAAMLQIRNNAIWRDGENDLEAMFEKEVRAKGLLPDAINIDSRQRFRAVFSALEEAGHSKAEIVRLLGLDHEEKS